LEEEKLAERAALAVKMIFAFGQPTLVTLSGCG
jgi:hypothetical protein